MHGADPPSPGPCQNSQAMAPSQPQDQRATQKRAHRNRPGLLTRDTGHHSCTDPLALATALRLGGRVVTNDPHFSKVKVSAQLGSERWPLNVREAARRG